MEPKDYISVSDSITGNSVQIPILSNSIISALPFAKLNPAAPIRLFDPGFKNTTVSNTAISQIDRENGLLYYRGYDVCKLVQNSSFLEVAFLLIYGSLPSKAQLTKWDYDVTHHTYIHVELERQMTTYRYDAHPMGMVIGTLSSLSTFHPEANPALQGDIYSIPPNASAARISAAWSARNRAIYRLLGKITTIASNALRHRIGRPYNHPMPNSSSYVENFFYMIQKLNVLDFKPDPALVQIFDEFFVVLAEFGSNCSTVTMRHLISSGVDPYSALSGALAALFGERKCSDVIEMLNLIKSSENIPKFLSLVKKKAAITGTIFDCKRPGSKPNSRPLLLQGFGHRLYKNCDPRVAIAKNLALRAQDLRDSNVADVLQLAIEFEAAVSTDEYFTVRKLTPNIDYWSAVLLHICKFPKGSHETQALTSSSLADMFPVILAIPRVAGLISHWIESIDDPEFKIFRPRQLFYGNDGLKVPDPSSSHLEEKDIGNPSWNCSERTSGTFTSAANPGRNR